MTSSVSLALRMTKRWLRCRCLKSSEEQQQQQQPYTLINAPANSLCIYLIHSVLHSLLRSSLYACSIVITARPSPSLMTELDECSSAVKKQAFLVLSHRQFFVNKPEIVRYIDYFAATPTPKIGTQRCTITFLSSSLFTNISNKIRLTFFLSRKLSNNSVTVTRG